jgi:hypothetical protein
MSNERFEELSGRLLHAADGAQLDAVARLLWVQHGNGYLTDFEADELSKRIQALRGSPGGFVTAIGSAAASAVVAAKRARRVKSADARDRMRSAAFGGWLPRTLAAMFTIGELAVLSVIAREVAARGFCDLHVGTIAYRAGVSVRTVRNARHLAVERGVITCHQRGNSKNGLANVVRIVSREWLSWVAKRAPAKGGKMTPPCLNRSEDLRADGSLRFAARSSLRLGAARASARAVVQSSGARS